MNVLPPDRKNWSKELLELWAERAAIMEHDGKMSKEKAEREAELDIRRIVERNFLKI